MSFSDKLRAAQQRTSSWVCIGLDPDPAKMPSLLRGQRDAITIFNQAIVEACKDFACAFKPNLAFYLSHGTQGLDALSHTLRAIPPDVPVILDAKFGDIDSSARGYARFAFEELGVDAVTLSPYLGSDALDPFLEYAGKAIFVLTHTSNRGARQFQDLDVDKVPLYVHVAQEMRKIGGQAEIGLVVGATFPDQMRVVREANPDALLLIPGVGAQGGSIESTVRFGPNSAQIGPLVNASRTVLYASPNDDYARAARQAAEKLRGEINDLARIGKSQT